MVALSGEPAGDVNGAASSDDGSPLEPSFNWMRSRV
jgi:hypothetical protein